MKNLIFYVYLGIFDLVLLLTSLRSGILQYYTNQIRYQWITFSVILFMYFFSLEVLSDLVSFDWTYMLDGFYKHIFTASISLLLSYLHYYFLLFYIKKHIDSSEDSPGE